MALILQRSGGRRTILRRCSSSTFTAISTGSNRAGGWSARPAAIGVSLDKPAVDPKRHIAVINHAGQEISKVPVYSKPSAA